MINRIAVVILGFAVAACSSPASEDGASTNQPPTAPTVSISPVNPKTDDELKVFVVTPSTDPEGGTVTHSFRWLKNGAPQPDLTTDTVPAAATTKGDVWAVVVTPSDGKLNGPTAERQVTIENSAPVVSVVLEPTNPTRASDLKAVPSAVDADGDMVQLSWAWTSDGAATSIVSDKVPSDQLVRGAVWQVTVVPTDGVENGVPVVREATIANEPPVLSEVSLPALVTKAGAVMATPGATSDIDGDLATVSYLWWVDGTPVEGATTNVLEPSRFAKGQTVEVSVTPNDGIDDGTPRMASVTVSNSTPSVPVAAVAKKVSDDIGIVCAVSVPSTDLDGDAISYTFTWTRNGQTYSGAVTNGASSTVDASMTTGGDVFGCAVAASDGDSMSATSAEVSATVNRKPTLDGVTLSPATPSKAGPIDAQPGSTTDADGDVVSLKYVWSVNGAVLSGQPTASLSESLFAKDQEVLVTVTPNDGIDDGTPRMASVTVSNSTPTVPGVSMTSTPKVTDHVVCSVSSPSSDLDGDAISYTFSWKKNGQAYSGAVTNGPDSSTVDASMTTACDVFECMVVADDGNATATSANSSTIVGVGEFETKTIAGVDFEFSCIPSGTFLMGAPMSDTEAIYTERPQFQVTLTKPFFVLRHEVTQEQYDAVISAHPATTMNGAGTAMSATPSYFKGDTSRPVEKVSWDDAVTFCQKLSQLSGANYRLPTAAEWEFAARAGTTTPRYGAIADIAWYEVNSGGSTHPVMGKDKNAWGLYDMLGNVWEWTADWYASYPGTAVTDPTGPSTGTNRLIFGGGAANPGSYARASRRLGFLPDSRTYEVGFRPVMSVP